MSNKILPYHTHHAPDIIAHAILRITIQANIYLVYLLTIFKFCYFFTGDICKVMFQTNNPKIIA